MISMFRREMRKEVGFFIPENLSIPLGMRNLLIYILRSLISPVMVIGLRGTIFLYQNEGWEMGNGQYWIPH